VLVACACILGCAALLRFVQQLSLPGTTASDAVEALVDLPEQLLSIIGGISRGTSAVEDNFNKASMHANAWQELLPVPPARLRARLPLRSCLLLPACLPMISR
jgi:hypothetical protein